MIPIRSGEYLNIPKTRKLSDEEKKAAKKKIEASRERDNEMVNATFKNLECPGTSLDFWFKKYDEPPRYFSFCDGQTYSVPRMVVDHINIHTQEATFEYQKNPFGSGEVPVISNTGKKKTKYLFVNAAGF